MNAWVSTFATPEPRPNNPLTFRLPEAVGSAMDQLLTIGALAERCRLSRSALRFYDQCGLLQPVAVDEATGYRYYQEAQVEVANLVRQLRRAEVPVEDVRAFLVGRDRRAPEVAGVLPGEPPGAPYYCPYRP